jgi:hypothetical protein
MSVQTIPMASEVLAATSQVRSARAALLSEFDVREGTYGYNDLLDRMDAQRRCTVRDREGRSVPARYWRSSVRELWEIINGAEFYDAFTYEGAKYQRSHFFSENKFIRELCDRLREQLDARVFIQEFEPSLDRRGEWRPAATYLKFQLC